MREREKDKKRIREKDNKSYHIIKTSISEFGSKTFDRTIAILIPFILKVIFISIESKKNTISSFLHSAPHLSLLITFQLGLRSFKPKS
jgi:hypothetical protein